MLFSGIDLHKRTIAIQTVDATGTVVREARLAARHDTLSASFATLPGPNRAVVECIGMWYWVRDLLEPQGIDLRLGHAKYLKAISYAKVKTTRWMRDLGPAAAGGSDPGGRHDQRGAT